MRVLLHSKSSIVADVPGFEREPEDRADADLTAESAGRLCYLSGDRPNPKTATNPDYLLNIENEHHYSVLGHSAATFYIDGITRNCTHEIIRHRWFTFSEVSQRYVDVDRLGAALHPGLSAWMDTNLENDDGRQDMLMTVDRVTKDAYRIIVDELIRYHHYTKKRARQAARHVLPGGTETKMMMSGNLRAWRDFLAQRLAPGADEEIRNVALEIYKILKAEFPSSFQDFDSHGMITFERLVQRAYDRYYRAEATSTGPSTVHKSNFVYAIMDLLKDGLWTLKKDPWNEDEA